MSMVETDRRARPDYELGHRNVPLADAIRRLDDRIRKDRRGNCDPEYGLMVGPGMYEEICSVLAALRAPAGGGSAGAEAEGRALRMTLLFTHEAACNGLLLRNSPDGTLDLVAEDICVAAAADLGCELGDAAWEGMLAQARTEVAAVALPTDTDPPGSPDADGTEDATCR